MLLFRIQKSTESQYFKNIIVYIIKPYLNPVFVMNVLNTIYIYCKKKHYTEIKLIHIIKNNISKENVPRVFKKRL